MSALPDAGKQLDAISSVVDAWLAYRGETVPQGQLAARLGQFPHVPVNAVRRFKPRLRSGNWTELDEFIVAAPTTAGEPHLFPVAKLVFRLQGDDLNVSVRLALLFAAESGPRHDGWRFELADPYDPSGSKKSTQSRAHHFPHAQRITSWARKSPAGLWHDDYLGTWNDSELDESSTEVNEARPAFPLRCDTPAGLIVAVLASLYGSAAADEILESVSPRPSRWLKDEADRITGRTSV